MNAAEQLADIKARADAVHNVNVRSVIGGYVITGQTTYVEKNTGSALAQVSHESVTFQIDDVASLVKLYLATGSFDLRPV